MTDVFSQAAQRLDMINTQWSLVRRAHGDASLTAEEARRALVLRYSPAVRRYVGAIVRNDAEADDLAQDVVLRLMRGDFGGADASRGRFRDLLKTSLRNMVRNHWAKQNRRRPADVEVHDLPLEAESAADDPWLEAWRNNLLDLTWANLEDYERTHKGSVAFTVLRLRADHPDDSSDELAGKLSAILGKPVRADSVRQQLKRARDRFAELLVKQVADVLDDPAPDRIQEELSDLGLLDRIRDFLPGEAE